MKRRHRNALLLSVLLALLACAPGCQFFEPANERPPLQTADELGQGYNRTAEALIAQKKAGKISDAAWPWIVNGMTIVADLLTEVEDAALREPPDVPTFRALVRAFLEKYEERLLRPKVQAQRGLPVTTRPSP